MEPIKFVGRRVVGSLVDGGLVEEFGLLEIPEVVIGVGQVHEIPSVAWFCLGGD